MIVRCERRDEVLRPGALDDLAVQVHAATCADCRARLERQRRALLVLRADRAGLEPRAEARVWARIEAARDGWGPRGWGRWPILAPAAAALAVVLALLLWRPADRAVPALVQGTVIDGRAGDWVGDVAVSEGAALRWQGALVDDTRGVRLALDAERRLRLVRGTARVEVQDPPFVLVTASARLHSEAARYVVSTERGVVEVLAGEVTVVTPLTSWVVHAGEASALAGGAVRPRASLRDDAGEEIEVGRTALDDVRGAGGAAPGGPGAEVPDVVVADADGTSGAGAAIEARAVGVPSPRAPAARPGRTPDAPTARAPARGGPGSRGAAPSTTPPPPPVALPSDAAPTTAGPPASLAASLAAPTAAPPSASTPPIPATARDLADARQLLGRDDRRAAALADAVVARAPESVEALLVAADARRRQRLGREAEAFYARAVAHPDGAPFLEEALLRTAELRADRGDRAGALGALAAARSARTAFLGPERAALEARLHLESGDPAAAATALEAVARSPDRLLDRVRLDVGRALAPVDRARAHRLLAPLRERSGAVGDAARALIADDPP